MSELQFCFILFNIYIAASAVHYGDIKYLVWGNRITFVAMLVYGLKAWLS